MNCLNSRSSIKVRKYERSFGNPPHALLFLVRRAKADEQWADWAHLVMFDVVALGMVLWPELFEAKPVLIYVDEKDFTRIDESKKTQLRNRSVINKDEFLQRMSRWILKENSRMIQEDSVTLIKRIKTLADTGLLYAENEFDRERYEELLSISHELMSSASGQPLEVLKQFYMPVEDYPTPKVDVRGLMINEKDEILMVREQSDQKWALPGGWCEIGFTPSEVIEKEIQEETGLVAKAVRLLAVFDKKCHAHPPEPFYVYKFNFLCTVESGELKIGHDMLGVSFFPLDDLPPLSENRNVKSQIHRLYELAKDPNSTTYFD